MGKKAKDLTGVRSGRWTALYRTNKVQPAMWLCRCDCGTEREVWSFAIDHKTSESCGCVSTEKLIKRITTHGFTGTKEYSSWLHIIQRCKPSCAGYGGRGIKIDPIWRKDFLAFYKHIGPCPEKEYSVDRIDNNGNYEPGNVRWATKEVQRNNSSNVKVHDYHGERLTTRQVLNKSNSKIPMQIVSRRLNDGWSIYTAVDTPISIRHSLNARRRRNTRR